MSRQILSTLRPFRVLRKWRPLDISFDPPGLMTGQSLVPIRCGDRTSYIRAEKYAALKVRLSRIACPVPAFAPVVVAGTTVTEAVTKNKERGYDGRLLIGNPPRVVNGVSQIYFRSATPHIENITACPQCDERNAQPDCIETIQYEIIEERGKLRCSHCPLVYEPSIHSAVASDNSYWDKSTKKYRPFIRSEWEEVFLHHDDDGRLIINSRPYPQTQLPPAPLKNATDYQMFYIQDINKKTHSIYRGDWARFEKNLKKFDEKMDGIWAARKLRYETGEDLLREAGFNRHTESAGGPADPSNINGRFPCPRCGCSFRQERVCYDCGFNFKKYARKLRLQREKEDDREGPIVIESPIVKHRVSGQDFVSFLLADGRFGDILDSQKLKKLMSLEKPKMPKDLVPIALLIEGRFKNLIDPEKVRNLAGIYAQLVEGWYDRDVINLLENDGNEETIRKRATRFFQDFKEYLEYYGEFPYGCDGEFLVPSGIAECQ